MKILLTGAGGMLAQALQKTFIEDEVIALGQQELDITSQDLVQKKVAELAPQVIINAAAYTNVDGAETDKETTFKVNEIGVRNLAEAANQASATMVHYSTDYIFPGDNPLGYTENAVPGPPVNIYGESKLAGEQALVKSGCRYYLLRTAWLYGPGGKNFVDTMLTLAETKPELSVVSDQHGSPTFTYDVAAATKWLLSTYAPGIYHMVNSGTTTWYDFARKIFELSDKKIIVKPVTSKEFPRPARRPEFSALKNTRGPTMRPWDAALDDYLKNYQNH